MSTEHGAPAFPLNELNQVTGDICAQHFGMTLRDYFAAKAMQSILAVLHQGIRPADVPKMCADAWGVADAMLEARAQ